MVISSVTFRLLLFRELHVKEVISEPRRAVNGSQIMDPDAEVNRRPGAAGAAGADLFILFMAVFRVALSSLTVFLSASLSAGRYAVNAAN